MDCIICVSSLLRTEGRNKSKWKDGPLVHGCRGLRLLPSPLSTKIGLGMVNQTQLHALVQTPVYTTRCGDREWSRMNVP